MAARTRQPDIPDNCPHCGEPVDLLVNGQCPECRAAIFTLDELAHPPFFSMPAMRYQNHYVWLVFVSALDIIMTALVLFVWQGSEANPVAASIIAERGFGWAILFKFGMMLTAVISCELVGRRNHETGRKLATAALVINAMPVAFTFALLTSAGPPPAAAALLLPCPPAS